MERFEGDEPMEFKLKEYLTAGDVFEVMEVQDFVQSGNNVRMSKKMMLKLISVCLESPKMTPDDLSKLPSREIASIFEPCMKLYGESWLPIEDKKK
jgi:hypothetical protein